MQKRFIVKPVKIVWRNNVIAGNPITESFKKFGVYDRNWKEDWYCLCPYPNGEWALKLAITEDDCHSLI